MSRTLKIIFGIVAVAACALLLYKFLDWGGGLYLLKQIAPSEATSTSE